MRNYTSLRSLTAALALTTALVGVTGEAFAQIDDIIVTTRKRAENLQDVPIVITTFSAASIERKGIASLEDVAKYTNGVILDEGFSKQDTRITIRGLSPTRGRQNVAVLQDDVDISSLAISTAGGSFTINPRLLDIERIEIVKGPHSALYGRSAFNGAINYITRKPGQEFYGNAQVDLGTYKKAEGRVSVSGPVSDKVSLGFNAGIWTFGGFYNSSVSGGDLGGTNGKGLAGSIAIKPNDMFKVTARTEWSDDHFDPEARSILNPSGTLPTPASALGTSTAAPNGAVFLSTNVNNLSFPQVFGTLGTAKSFPKPAPSRDPRTGQDYPGSDREIFRTTIRAEADFESTLLTSITHYGHSTAAQFGDQFGIGDAADPNVNGLQETNFDTDTKLFTEELRLQSQGDSALKWLVGGLFWNEFAEQDGRSVVCASSGGGCAADIKATTAFNGGNFGPQRNITKRDTHHWSGYLNLEYAVTDRIKVSAEARYTKEKEDTTSPFSSSPSIIGCAGTGAPGGRTISATTGLVVCGPFGPNTVGPLILVPATAAQIAANPAFISAANPYYLAAQVESTFWTPRATIDFKATDDALLYATVAQAKKPGGYASIGGGSTLADNVFDEESMWVYEGGAKTEWLDNRLQANLAAYYQDFSKKQVQVVVINELTGLPTTKTVNAAKARVKGLEADIIAAPSENVSFNVGYTFNDAKYKNFKDITNSVSTVTRAGNCTIKTVTLASGAQSQRCIVDYSGRRLEGAPKHNVQLGGEVRGTVSADLGWFIDAESRYQSNRFTTFENTLEIPSYWNVDLRIGVRTDKWSITSYVNNIFNDDHLKANAVYIPNWNISFLPPRNTVISGASALLPDKRQFGVRANATF